MKPLLHLIIQPAGTLFGPSNATPIVAAREDGGIITRLCIRWAISAVFRRLVDTFPRATFRTRRCSRTHPLFLRIQFDDVRSGEYLTTSILSGRVRTFNLMGTSPVYIPFARDTFHDEDPTSKSWRKKHHVRLCEKSAGSSEEASTETFLMAFV